MDSNTSEPIVGQLQNKSSSSVDAWCNLSEADKRQWFVAMIARDGHQCRTVRELEARVEDLLASVSQSEERIQVLASERDQLKAELSIRAVAQSSGAAVSSSSIVVAAKAYARDLMGYERELFEGAIQAGDRVAQVLAGYLIQAAKNPSQSGDEHPSGQPWQAARQHLFEYRRCVSSLRNAIARRVL